MNIGNCNSGTNSGANPIGKEVPIVIGGYQISFDLQSLNNGIGIRTEKPISVHL